ncbi:hypothetical protein [Pseudomonas bohemica]|uniref:hypothetical protein n=1 Tax=Pseudomonas bohemica TaxID=2044872 RepID=UPI0018FEFA7A|nr:hypothetical protein [Pseudomonas bohemica]
MEFDPYLTDVFPAKELSDGVKTMMLSNMALKTGEKCSLRTPESLCCAGFCLVSLSLATFSHCLQRHPVPDLDTENALASQTNEHPQIVGAIAESAQGNRGEYALPHI